MWRSNLFSDRVCPGDGIGVISKYFGIEKKEMAPGVFAKRYGGGRHLNGL